MANIQIPEALFYDILRYYIISSKGEDVPEELDKRVFDGLSDKVQKITDRELYTTYKSAPTAEEKEKELAQLKAKQKKLQQQQKALERKARTKRLIETGALIESVLGRPVEQEDIEPIKQLIEYYRNKKLSGQTYSDKK